MDSTASTDDRRTDSRVFQAVLTDSRDTVLASFRYKTPAVQHWPAIATSLVASLVCGIWRDGSETKPATIIHRHILLDHPSGIQFNFRLCTLIFDIY